MLKKIMGIMNRKPKGNGLDGVPLKRSNSDDDFDENMEHNETFQGNADISLIQSNVDPALQNRFSFEIGANQIANPFKPEESQAKGHMSNDYTTQPLTSPDLNGILN